MSNKYELAKVYKRIELRRKELGIKVDTKNILTNYKNGQHKISKLLQTSQEGNR